MTRDQLGPRTVGACFVATLAISYAGAIVLGPTTAGWYVICLGVLSFVAAVVLEHVAPLAEVGR